MMDWDGIVYFLDFDVDMLCPAILCKEMQVIIF